MARMKAKAIRINQFFILFEVVSFLLAQEASSAPLPPQLLVNENTQQCTWHVGTDECNYCFFREGWESVGFEGMCPDGYVVIDDTPDSSFCLPSRGNQCCSENFSGFGDCDGLAFNEQDELCSITNCEQLPSDWTRDAPAISVDGRCPLSFEWVESPDLDCDDPCEGLAPCSECIDNGCVWSLQSQQCHSACKSPAKCLVTPSFDIDSEELCEELTSSSVVCPADVRECEDGSFVSRNPENGCEFFPCPEFSCCDPNTEPTVLDCFEAYVCCPDGTWSCERVLEDVPLESFICGGVATTGPFPEPCPCCDPSIQVLCVNGQEQVCCADGEWSCESCSAPGIVCEEEPPTTTESTPLPCCNPLISILCVPGLEQVCCEGGQWSCLPCSAPGTVCEEEPPTTTTESSPAPCCDPSLQLLCINGQEQVCCANGEWSCESCSAPGTVCEEEPSTTTTESTPAPCCNPFIAILCVPGLEPACCADGVWSCLPCSALGTVCEEEPPSTSTTISATTTEQGDNDTTGAEVPNDTTMTPPKQEEPPCEPNFCHGCYYFCGEPPYTCDDSSDALLTCTVHPLCQVCSIVCQLDSDGNCPVGCPMNDADLECL